MAVMKGELTTETETTTCKIDSTNLKNINIMPG